MKKWLSERSECTAYVSVGAGAGDPDIFVDGATTVVSTDVWLQIHDGDDTVEFDIRLRDAEDVYEAIEGIDRLRDALDEAERYVRQAASGIPTRLRQSF
jgi:hypothetical protein